MDHVRKSSSGRRNGSWFREGAPAQRESGTAVSSGQATSGQKIRILVPSALHTRGLACRVGGHGWSKAQGDQCVGWQCAREANDGATEVAWVAEERQRWFANPLGLTAQD